MKNFLCSIFILGAILLTSTTAFAAVQEQFVEGIDLSQIKRLAVAYPNHYKVRKVSDEPTIEALIEMLGTASKSTKFTVVPYADIVDAIKSDKDVDITTLDYRESDKTFKENVGKYADAYVILTTANASDTTTFMFKVMNAQTNDIMYMCNIKSRSFEKNARGYNSACEFFYKMLDDAIKKTSKK